jgi:hypothetical protein
VTGVADFEPEAVIELLGRHQVRYVLIGGLAAITHGAAVVTMDIDVCYARVRDNLERLAEALREVRASLRNADQQPPFHLDARTLAAGDTFTFSTAIGPIDILGTPSGVSGYDELARTADVFEVFGQRVLVASVDDLIRMKRAAGRPKDLLAAEELGALREEIHRRT